MAAVEPDIRPVYHFTPRQGWINDPNGLVYFKGQYHLFAQHYPHDVRWGPMHWLHAVSDDLIHWQELPIALTPDADGMFFSGSAWYDADNRSGLGTTETPPLLLFYTLTGDRPQAQHIAWSSDGIHFHYDNQNPVVENPGIVDFRDPKVFFDPKGKRFHMVVAAGDHVEFFASDNLRSWSYTGQFGPEGNHCPGVWECPDLFPLECEGRTYWVLLVSHIRPRESGGPKTQYFVGQFDGRSFHCTQPESAPVWLDPGLDNYAAVSFAGVPFPLVIGWGSNWDYETRLPTQHYKGQMTYPRALRLVETSQGLRLAASPWPDISRLSPSQPTRVIDQPGVTSALANPAVIQIQAQGSFQLHLSNDCDERWSIQRNDDNELILDRQFATKDIFWPETPDDVFSRVRINRTSNTVCSLTVFLDRTNIEVFADDGLIACHQLLYARQPYDQLMVEGEATVTVRDLTGDANILD